MDCVFIDRDGTMGGGESLEYPDTFRPFPFLGACVEMFRAKGILVFGFTNQSCIARGRAGNHDFEGEFAGYGFDGLYLCPHDAGDGCGCRKPMPGLLYRAAREHGLDLSACVVIGDRESDLEAGFRAGCSTVLVRTGRVKTDSEEREFQKYNLLFVADDLLEAARRLTGEDNDR